MKYEIIEVEIATQTINKADPTQIYKKVGQRNLKNVDTLIEAKDFLIRDIQEEQDGYDMCCLMAGSSEFVPTEINEIFVIEKETGNVFGLEMVKTGMEYCEEVGYEVDNYEYQIVPHKQTLEEMYPEGWQM